MMRARETFSPAQCRAARGLLNWTREDLAHYAGIELEAVEIYEAGAADLDRDELVNLGRVFTGAGVVALPARLAGEGVRLSRSHGAAEPAQAVHPWQSAAGFDRLPLAAKRGQVGRIIADVAEHLTAPTDTRVVHDRRA